MKDVREGLESRTGSVVLEVFGLPYVYNNGRSEVSLCLSVCVGELLKMSFIIISRCEILYTFEFSAMGFLEV